MTVFSGRQVVPMDYAAEASQRLLENLISGDLKAAVECVADPSLDVNFVGAVRLKVRKAEVVPRGESASEVCLVYEEYKADVTPLFVAVHQGNVDMVKTLLSNGADVNQRIFRGYVTTAAVREGHQEILEILIKSGASQPACEEAFLEASCHGQAKLLKLLMSSDLISPHIGVHALVTSSCRGFTEAVTILLKCGVDANATGRVLLCSSKPSLHVNADCNALTAAVVSRQIASVRLLLQAGISTDIEVRFGAWSWDSATGEEFRVGAGLAEPYNIVWCAVEYFEESGEILQMLLCHNSTNIYHFGRTLLHHAILCANSGAIKVLLNFGAKLESPIKTAEPTGCRPIHLATRLGLPTILQHLIDYGCDSNSATDSGETALMICAKLKQAECLKILGTAGADFGILSNDGLSCSEIAVSNNWSFGFLREISEMIRSGQVPASCNLSIFSPLIFVARAGDVETMKVLLKKQDMNLDYMDKNGFSAVMIAVLQEHVDIFRLLVNAGAEIKLRNSSGDSAISLSKESQNRDLFEKVMLEFALEKGNQNAGGSYPLHFASRSGELDAVNLLVSRGYDINLLDSDGYTPLMLAAREGHGPICSQLISLGACCHVKNCRGETALLLARRVTVAEHFILNELSRKLVLGGARLLKHTKGGKGRPHWKEVCMVEESGELRWGNFTKRNVACRDAVIGPSLGFQKSRLKFGDANEPGLFRVMISYKKEVHFLCDGGSETAELWVRGIKLLTKEALQPC